MIIAVDKLTNVVRYATYSVVLSDGKPVQDGTMQIIADNVPADFQPNKYLYVNGAFEPNPSYVQ